MSYQFVVLVADASDVNLELMQFHMDRLDLDVHVARDGLEAIDLALDVNPDIILLDIHLPEVDGFEVCKALKGNYLFAEIPILLMTDGTEPEVLLKGLSLGASDYLARPFVREDLEQRLQMHLARSRENVTVTGVSLQQGLAYAAGARKRMRAPAPTLSGPVRLATVSQPGRELVGDVAGACALGPGHAALWMLSVEERGIAPTLLAASIHALMSPEPGRGLPLQQAGGSSAPRAPDEVLRIVAQAFPDGRVEFPYHLSYALVDAATGGVTVAWRGSPPPPLRLRADGASSPLSTGGAPEPDALGVSVVRGRLERGDLLVLPGRFLHRLPTEEGAPGLDEVVATSIREARDPAAGDPFGAASRGALFALHRHLAGAERDEDLALALLGYEMA